MKHDVILIGGVFIAGAAAASLAGVLLVRWAVGKMLP